jgi:3-oxoadipate enol-lactonase
MLGYDIDGPSAAPALLLGSSLGTTAAMWQPQVEVLSRHFRVVRFDHRGHGRSSVPDGPYALADLGRDVLALLDDLGLDRVSYAGVSLGGMVGMWLAANAPQRIDRLGLICTSAYVPPPAKWLTRAETVRTEGLAAIADAVVGAWFTPQFRDAHPETFASFLAMMRAAPPLGYAGCCAAIAGMDLRTELPRIVAPTLVIAGASDLAIPPDHGRAIAEELPGSRFELVAGAHIASVESADAVTTLLLRHMMGADG